MKPAHHACRRLQQSARQQYTQLLSLRSIATSYTLLQPQFNSCCLQGKFCSLTVHVPVSSFFFQAPAQCVEHAVNSKRQPQLVVDVCKGASSVAPAECLNLLPRSLPDEAAVGICSRAQGVGPAVCATAKGQLSHGAELTSRLCRGASGQGPADCFRRSALVNALSLDDRVDLCSGAKTDGPARYAHHRPCSYR